MSKTIDNLKLIFLGFCFLTTSSCHQGRVLLSLGKKTSSTKKDVSDQAPAREEKLSQPEEYPAVYLKRKNRFIDINTFNRRHFSLDLLDQVVFSDKKTNFSLSPLKNLKEFQDLETLKVRVSSFCSLTEEDIDEDDKGRIVEEFGSQTYHSFFSIAEILPKKVLFSDLGQVYCSFIFVIKNRESGHLNYYNITQQAIHIQDSYSLNLSKKAKSGDYLSYNRRLIQSRHIHNMYLLNNTQKLVENYILLCEGLKNTSIPSDGLNITPIFTNLITYDLIDEDYIKEETQVCRFVSKNNHKVTGVTALFELDFNSLYSQVQNIDLTKIEEPALFKDGKNFYPKGSEIPLNTYFYFPNLTKIIESETDYNLVDVIVNTKCYDNNKNPQHNLFRISNVISTKTNLALREKIPLMAVTPQKVFQIGIMQDVWQGFNDSLSRVNFCNGVNGYCDPAEAYVDFLSGEHYKTKERDIQNDIHCIYQLSLKDRNKPHNQVHFEDQYYRIAWSGAPYGVDYIPIEGEKLFMSHNEYKFPSVNPTNLYHQLTGYLSLNFFDTVGSEVFWAEGLNKINIECYEGLEHNRGVVSYKNFNPRDSIEVSIPYNDPNSPIPIQPLFSHPDLKPYLETKTPSFCRVMFYEEDILRYFSGEMKIFLKEDRFPLNYRRHYSERFIP